MKLMPNPTKLLNALHEAIALHNIGRLDEADVIYRQVLQRVPQHPDALHLRALVCHAKAQFAEAAQLAEAAIRSAPRIANLRNTAGEAWRRQGVLDKARQRLNEAIRLDPALAMAHHNLSLVCSAEGRFEEARQSNQRVLRLNPGYVDALVQGLDIASELDDEVQTAELLLRLQKFAGQEAATAAIASCHVKRARRLLTQCRFAEADQAAQAAIAISPTFWGGWALRGEAHFEQLELVQAELFCTMAAHLAPHNEDARLNLSTLLKNQQRLKEAAAHVNDWLADHPSDAKARFSLAGIALIQGNYAAGWDDYEVRWQMPGAQSRFAAAAQWAGQPVDRLLLYAEQGLGDTVQMLRFIPEVVGRCSGVVVLQVQPPLLRLAQRVFGGIGVTVTESLPTTPFDAACPLMSLPHVLGAHVPERLLGQVPYLSAESVRTAEFSTLLSRQPGKKMGIVWRGSEGSSTNRLRALPEAAIAPLLQLAGWTPVSLQFGLPSPVIAGVSLLDLSAEIADFEDLAAAMMSVDVVVSLDTGPAHLAGALGVRVMTLLPWLHDWRWGLAGDRCDWYASMSLFRQPVAGTWDAPIGQLSAQLDGVPTPCQQSEATDTHAQVIIDNHFPFVRAACRYGTFTLPLFDHDIARSMLAYGEYAQSDAALLCSLLRPGDIAVEVGANLGSLTLAMASAVGTDGQVIAFESHSIWHHCLTQTLADNGIAWVQARRQAVVAVSTAGDCEAAEFFDLDELALGACRLLKIDVEGFALAVLQGAINWTTQVHPIIYVTCDQPNQREPLVSFFKGMGYQVFMHEAPLFSPDNARQCRVNFFPDRVSCHLLALPTGVSPPPNVTQI